MYQTRCCFSSLLSLAIFLLVLSPSFAEETNAPAQNGAKSNRENSETALLQRQAREILKKRCHGCHGVEHRHEDLDVLDPEHMIDHGYVVPGNLKDSTVWDAIDSDRMPQGGPPLSDAERAVIRRWITEANAAFPPAPARTPLGLSHLLTHLRDRLQQASDEAARRNLRFFTLVHVYNDLRVTDEELGLYRAALAKAINSVSRAEEIVVPEALDDQQTVFAVDLRRMNWRDPRTAWLEVLDVYPYGLKFDNLADGDLSQLAREVYTLAGSDLPYVHADWFIVTATRPPLYYRLLDLAASLDGFLADLDVDLERSFLLHKIVRGGVDPSGVSLQNRVLDRVATGQGRILWLSYDFQKENNADDPQTANRRILEAPLGPKFKKPDDHPFPELAFQHDGGELIATLPNGLHFYYLVRSDGTRIDEGPIDIVSDDVLKTAGDTRIVTGLSCIGCHRLGIIEFQDILFQNLLAVNPPLGGEALTKLRRLVPGQERLQDLFGEDQRAYLAALRKAVGPFLPLPNNDEEALAVLRQTPEPIHFVARRYHAALRLNEGAAELGVAENALQALLNSPTVASILRPWRNGGKVKRAVWESRRDGRSLFQQAARLVLPGATPALVGLRAEATDLRAALAEEAEVLARTIREQKQNAVALGAVTSSAGAPSSAGSLITKILREELEKLDLTIPDRAELEIKGDFGPVQDKNNKFLALQLRLRLVDRSLQELVAVKIIVFDAKEAFVNEVLAPSGPLDPARGEQQRNEEILKRTFDPQTVLRGLSPRERQALRLANRDEPFAGLAVSDQSPYVVEVLERSGEQFVPVVPTLDEEGRASIWLAKGAEFRLRLVNLSDYDAAVKISLDGLSMFEFSEQKGYSHVIIPKGEFRDIRGWHITNYWTDLFVATDYAGSAAAKLKRSVDVATITVQFAAAWPANQPPPPDEVGVKGVGVGPRVKATYREVVRHIGKTRAVISIRYDIDPPRDAPQKN